MPAFTPGGARRRHRFLEEDEDEALQLPRGINEDEGILGSFLEFISRPGWAARSLLSGDVGGAFRNVGQFANEFMLGGFVNPSFNLTNVANFLLPEDWELPDDFTGKEHRPEFSDLLHRWGIASDPKDMGTWTRLGLDIAGGIVTDPLSLLGGSIGKGVARGVSALPIDEAASVFRQGLSQTPKGRALLEGADDIALVKEKLGRGLYRGSQEEATYDAFYGAFQKPGTPDYTDLGEIGEGTLRALNNLQDVLGQGNKLTAENAFETFQAARDMSLKQAAVEADKALAALEVEGYLLKNNAMQIRIPGMEEPLAQVPDFWSKVRQATVPGMAYKAAMQSEKWRDPVMHAEEMLKAKLNWVSATLVDKTVLHAGRIPDAMRHAAQKIGFLTTGKNRQAERKVFELFNDIPAETQIQLGRMVADHREWYDELFERVPTRGPGSMGSPLPEWARAPMSSEDFVTHSDEMLMAQATKIAGRQGADAVQGFLDEMRKMPQELVDAGVWKKARGNPYYISQQTTHILNSLPADAFLKLRKYKGTDTFQQHLQELAKEHNIAPFVQMEDLQEFHLGALMTSRMKSHHNVLQNAALTKEAERLGMGAKDSLLSDYLRYQLAPLKKKETWEKVLGGGDIHVDLQAHKSFPDWIKKHARFGIEGKGTKAKGVATYKFPGLNSIWKPMLTVMWPAFHVRNFLSASVMGLLDPDIGLDGMRGILPAVRNSYPVRELSKLGWSGDDISQFVRALHAPKAERGAALALLKGKKWGAYDVDQVADMLDGLLGGSRVNMADLVESFNYIGPMGKGLADPNRDLKSIRGILGAWVELGERSAQYFEETFRTNGFLHLLKKGVDPTEAAARINKAFVSYDKNSTIERGLREVIPFVRFSLGATQWPRQFLDRPMGSGMSTLRGAFMSGKGMLEDEGVVPERFQDTGNVPLPWRDAEGNLEFLQGLGLPHEAALQVLGTPFRLDEARKNVLGALQPAIRLPLSAAVNRNFFFGGEFGEYRKAPETLKIIDDMIPNWFPIELTKKVTYSDGTVHREIDGVWNEILSSSPLSRMTRTVDKLVKRDQGAWRALVTAVTGVRVMTVDQEKELRWKLEEYLRAKKATGEIGEAIHFFARLDPESIPEDLKIALASLAHVKTEQRKKRRELKETRKLEDFQRSRGVLRSGQAPTLGSSFGRRGQAYD